MQQEINQNIIIEQIEMVIEKAIAENETVLVSLGKNVGEEENVMETENVSGGDNDNFQTQF